MFISGASDSDLKNEKVRNGSVPNKTSERTGSARSGRQKRVNSQEGLRMTPILSDNWTADNLEVEQTNVNNNEISSKNAANANGGIRRGSLPPLQTKAQLNDKEKVETTILPPINGIIPTEPIMEENSRPNSKTSNSSSRKISNTPNTQTSFVASDHTPSTSSPLNSEPSSSPGASQANKRMSIAYHADHHPHLQMPSHLSVTREDVVKEEEEKEPSVKEEEEGEEASTVIN